METILVTGVAGFIGSNLASKLLAQNCRVLGIDNLNAFYSPEIKRQNLIPLQKSQHFSFFEGDLCNKDFLAEVFKNHQPSSIVHLAAWAGVRPSLQKPEVYVRNNIGATTALLEAARSFKPRVVFASSSSVYGSLNAVPFREDMDVDAPISIYAATKRACEILCSTYHSLYDIDIWCLRFFTCYGPGQRPDLAIHKFTHLISTGKPIPLFGDPKSYRDYLYVDDCTDAVIKASQRCKGYEVINIGANDPVRLDRLVALLEEKLESSALIEKLPSQPGDVPRTHADLTKAQKLLDFAPKIKIETGLERFITWYRNHSNKTFQNS